MNDFKKMMTMNKEEMEEALKKLKATRTKEPNPFFTTCYNIMMPTIEKYHHFNCSKCSNSDWLEYRVYNDEANPIREYRRLAREFVDLGYDVKLKFFCNDCVTISNGQLSNMMFLFKAKGMNDYVYTEIDLDIVRLFREFEIVLAFLQGVDSYDKLREIVHGSYDDDIDEIIERITGLIVNDDNSDN